MQCPFWGGAGGGKKPPSTGCMERFSLSVAILPFCWLKTVAEYVGFFHHEGLLFEMHLLETNEKVLIIILAL